VLYALADPLSFLVLVAAFVLACTLSGWTASLLARAGGRPLEDPSRRRPDPRRHLDPFGCVAAAITGVGWPRAVTAPRGASRGRGALVALGGPLVLLLVAAACLVGAGLRTGAVEADTTVLQGGVSGLPLLPRVLLLVGLVHLFVGLLGLVPLPPLDGGRLLFALAPRTLGWQRAEHQLVERNLGVAAVLVLLLLPLAGRLPLLLALLSAAGRPLVRLLTGLG
jgi:Zn-dependent protease